jgi:D-alanyl-D-alanine carboxypeptidase
MRALAPLAAILSLASAFVATTAGRLSAEPLLLYEPATDQVLYAHDIDQPWHPASLTKIMTAYVVFNAIKEGRITLKTKIPISQNAHQAQPSKIGLPVGAEISIEFALKALIIKSANDIAIALAEGVDDNYIDFIAEMNATAKRLGMTRTRFVNPNGLPDDEQVTTARDLARLAKAVRRDFPEYNNYWSMPSVRIGRRRLRSHNSLLRTLEGANGMKTGFICDSGFNIVASAERDGRSLIAVVLGATTSQNRTIRAASLLEHGFEFYDWKQLLKTMQPLDKVPVSTTSTEAQSIRQSVPVGACNPQLARRVRARRRARLRRLRKLRRVHRRAVKRTRRKRTAKSKGGGSS